MFGKVTKMKEDSKTLPRQTMFRQRDWFDIDQNLEVNWRKLGNKLVLDLIPKSFSLHFLSFYPQNKILYLKIFELSLNTK